MTSTVAGAGQLVEHTRLVSDPTDLCSGDEKKKKKAELLISGYNLKDLPVQPHCLASNWAWSHLLTASLLGPRD